MFNKNGNNNGNGSANGVHKDTAVVARNGSGHRSDAANLSEHDPASSAGLALLWDGLSPAVSQALGQPLDPALASQRKGRAGRSYDYLEGHVVIEQANRIFGYGGWGYELAGDVTLRQIETVDTQTGEVKVASAYSAPVRVTVAGALPRTDIGVHPVAEDTLDGHDTALKGAVTDGMKRAFRSFGVQFGNGFYGDQPQVGNSPQPQRVPAQTNGNSGQAQARAGAAGAASPRSKSCGSGSSRSPPSRASTRTKCGRPSRTGRARASTTWTAPSLARWWRPPPTSCGRCNRPRPPKPAGPSGSQSSGVVSHLGAAPLLHYRTRRLRAMTTTETLVSTPWGWTHDIEELAEGVWRVWTPSHGGLKLSRERWAESPDLRPVRHVHAHLRRGGLRGAHRQDAARPGRRQREGDGAEGGGLLRPLRSGPPATSATARPASTTTPSPTGAASGRTPSGGSTPALRPSPSWATPRWCGPTGS